MPKPNPTIVGWMLNEIEADLKGMNLWESTPIDPTLIASSKQAFGRDVMTFSRWLQFVLLPNARRILETDQAWPNQSMVAAQAVREMDGWAGADSLLEHLAQFDALFGDTVDANGFPAWLNTINTSNTPSDSRQAVSEIHPSEPARLSLASLPTPLMDVPRLAAAAGVPSVRVKRDDLTGLELSGNKIRKLEYLIADAQARGCDTLITHGGFQSNHCRATAAAGARLGMRVRMFLRAPADTMSPAMDGNLFLDHLFGASISVHTPAEYNAQRQPIIDGIMAEERSAGRSPYFFPVGASVPIGCWGYIRCVHELRSQYNEGPVDLYVATSSGGTLAGCILGKAILGLDDWRIIGIPVSDSIAYFQTEVRRLLDETMALFNLDLTEAQTPIDLLDGYIGGGYAIPYPAAVAAIRLAATQAGLILDPTYTGKALHGMLDTLRAGKGRAGAMPVFLHTGGAFGLMARRDLFH